MSNIKCEYTELIELSKLKPHPKNPNNHPDAQIERLAEILKYQGMRSPIVVSKLSGFITKGHGRLAALKVLGWEKAPVDYQEYENEEMEYADIIADNAISRWAFLDISKINADFIDLGPELNMDMLGLKDFIVEPIEKYEDLDDLLVDIDIGQKNDEIHKDYQRLVLLYHKEDFQNLKPRIKTLMITYETNCLSTLVKKIIYEKT